MKQFDQVYKENENSLKKLNEELEEAEQLLETIKEVDENNEQINLLNAELLIGENDIKTFPI